MEEDMTRPSFRSEVFEVTAQYYTGSLAVDGVAMHKEAQQRQLKCEGSIVHAHLYLEECNDDCVRYI